MPQGIPIPANEIQHILDLFNDSRKHGRGLMESYEIVGKQVGRTPGVIANIIQRLRPTTDLAKMYFRAKALKMAKRVVKKGSPSELIDVLQRPSIGVLDPIKKIDTGPGGFFLTVNAESCGAVKVGVLQPGIEERKQLESGDEADFDPFADVIDVGQEVVYEPHGNAELRTTEPPPAPVETVIERVKRQLAERRQQAQGSGA